MSNIVNRLRRVWPLILMAAAFILPFAALAIAGGCTFAMNQTNGPTGIASDHAGRDLSATDTGNGAQTSKQTPTTKTDASAAVGDSAIKALTPIPPVVVEKVVEAKAKVEEVKKVETPVEEKK